MMWPPHSVWLVNLDRNKLTTETIRLTVNVLVSVAPGAVRARVNGVRVKLKVAVLTSTSIMTKAYRLTFPL